MKEIEGCLLREGSGEGEPRSSSGTRPGAGKGEGDLVPIEIENL